MATITSAASGNFSAPATWVGGVVPGASDDAVAATGHVVTIDLDVTVISVQQAGTGKFVLGNGRTLTGNVIANAGTYTTGGTVQVTATTGNSATINGNVSGVSTTTASTSGVVMSGTGTLTINGSITGTAGNASAAVVYTEVASTIIVNGNITGGTGTDKRGILNQTVAANITVNGTLSGNLGQFSNAIGIVGVNTTLSVTGNVTAGTGVAAHGIFANNASSPNITIIGNCIGGTIIALNALGPSPSITVTGEVIGGAADSHGVYAQGSSSTVNIVGVARGGSGNSHGVRSDATTANTGVIFQGNMIDSTTGVKAIYCRIFRLTATNSGYTQYQNNVTWPLGSPVYRVSPDNVTGMPAASNVRKPVVYGYSNQLTGTMAVPSAGSVASGVPVDNTTGTAILNLTQVAEAIGLQVAAGKST